VRRLHLAEDLAQETLVKAYGWASSPGRATTPPAPEAVIWPTIAPDLPRDPAARFIPRPVAADDP
jgi:hypothetical protein